VAASVEPFLSALVVELPDVTLHLKPAEFQDAADRYFPRTAVRNLERAGVSQSVATKVTSHKTESVYRRYPIVASSDLAEASRKLQACVTGTYSGTIGQFEGTAKTQKVSA
jgi:hypothetical protein